nr:MAG TPA: terminase large subunit [Caudoviricetes sp.]
MIHKIEYKTVHLFEKIFEVLEPPKPLTISSWAAEKRRLSREASAEPGRWNLDRAPYQRSIMDAISSPGLKRVVLMTSAQIGKTEMLLNTIGYYSEHDPSPIMVVNPTDAMAQAFSKDRLAPMIRDTECLKEIYGMAKSRDTANTILHKQFPGGHITMIGANAPTNLASRPIRILLLDEVDRYPASAGTEGDPVDLADKRTTTFWNRKVVLVSTPTEKGVSRIEKEYLKSSQEEWCVQCPYCGKYTPFKWDNLDFKDMMMKCDYCEEKLSEDEWKEQPGMFVAQNPSVTDIRGFHLNEMASPWKRWKDIKQAYLEAVKDKKETGSDYKLRTWVNTSLGEPYEVMGAKADLKDLINRREKYTAELPKGVLLLTAAVDVQDDRLELEVCGWGAGYESWGITYEKLYGNLEKNFIWEELEAFLSKPFMFEDGQALNIACTFIDTGGHFTTQSYKWLKSMQQKKKMIFGIKGMGSNGIPLLHKKSTNNQYNVPILILGVNAGKETVLERLYITEYGSGYCHFPENIDRGYDQKYMKGLTSEQRLVKDVKGKPTVCWVKRPGARNEPFDLRNYNTAAVEFLNPNFAVLAKKVSEGINYMQPQRTTTGKRKSGVVSRGIQ